MKYILPTLGTLAAIGVFAYSSSQGTATARDNQSRAETFQRLELFSDVMARVRKEYVVDVNNAELIEDAINGMLQSLDPHSSYMTAEEFKDWQVNISGEYGGLGMEVTTESGVVKVVAPIDDTPADRAGILAGDYLTEIDGDSIIGLSLSEAVERMRGEPGEPITVTVIRGDDDPREFTLTREVIKARETKYDVKDGMGYIRIPQFNEKTTDTFVDAVNGLKAEMGGRIPGLVLDLRGNPGGALDQSINISSAFLDGGEVVSTRGRQTEDVKLYNAEAGELLSNVPVVVLIDGASASASEIVAGAIQDRGRGLVLGMTSFGKGSVQSILPLRGGRDGALRLTTQRYYTPAGRSIQASGITPDILVSARPESDSRNQGLRESDLPNAIQNEIEENEASEELSVDILYPPAGYDEDGDFQLEKAIEILRDGTYSPRLASLQ